MRASDRANVSTTGESEPIGNEKELRKVLTLTGNSIFVVMLGSILFR